ncbi:hypothetical protein ACFFL1_07000 [Samsonia erythrinae]|uniref:Uncharacterized protein n=1 Tax=Samsonia erythrinae TaxID=160434 RepID=A0A4V6P2Z0_9GAMM|nr:hypothetical protein EDC54_102270 [Samsonia erythrinae]
MTLTANIQHSAHNGNPVERYLGHTAQTLYSDAVHANSHPEEWRQEQNDNIHSTREN